MEFKNSFQDTILTNTKVKWFYEPDFYSYKVRIECSPFSYPMMTDSLLVAGGDKNTYNYKNTYEVVTFLGMNLTMTFPQEDMYKMYTTLPSERHEFIREKMKEHVLSFNWPEGVDPEHMLDRLAMAVYGMSILNNSKISFASGGTIKNSDFTLDGIDAYVNSSAPTFTSFTQLEWAKDVIPNLKAIVKSPESGAQKSIYSIIMQLNDQYGWTFEEIADWLDTLEVDLYFKDKETGENYVRSSN